MIKELMLIMPRNERGFWNKVTNGKTGFVRLSLPAVAAATPPDWNVAIHDARAEPVDFDTKVGLVGITAFTPETPSAYAIADEFRSRGVPVVMGGFHVTAFPDEALEHADAVVIGEAEDVWESLLRDLEAGEMKKKYRADKVCDMKIIKPARRDLLDRSMYVACFNTIQATRGCPFDCHYCAVTQVLGQEYRTRPISSVVEEIQSFDTRDFFFVDDNICGKPSYSKELFRAIMPLKKTWGGQTSITIARDKELLDLYGRSGGRYAFIGFESLSEENLKRLNKSWNQAEGFGDSIRKIHDAGINILGSFILGLDGDDSTVFKRTLDFIQEHNIDAAQFNIVTPFPGTRLFDEMDRNGQIISKDWAKYHACEVVYQPAQMSVEEVEKRFYQLWRDMYSFPRMLKRISRSCRGIKYRIALNYSYRNKALRMPRL